ncbi:hypothetical protein B0H16DRAFT_1425096 [Mycena metata]|uniref:BZIP domain-containing protein n=1 Tax=Mycena metata TaxID=1033252 RepID=A0AAD7IAE2_9AGAR|nr:hypothetical protein B0H16DRAFT_1425096 [Mycena metata]
MQVDSPMSQQSLFGSGGGGYTDYQDLDNIFHTELFSLPSSGGSPSSSSSHDLHSSSSGSRESTPHLLTPPQPAPVHSFPDIGVRDGSPTPSFFNFLDEDVKTLDPLAMLSSAPYDFFGTSSFASNANALSAFSAGGSMDSEMSAMLGIDPQLVGSPAAQPYADFESSPSSSSSQTNSTSPNSESTSPTSPEPVIAPVKVGGHGKARKGTVVSGGIKKASSSAHAHPPAASTSAAKENTATAASNMFMPATPFKPRAAASNKGGDDDDDDDDLPADWRPPPEVFQKMSSKEKRQLRNKISARNFRVRRKEYISTLEDNIAERDRLLSAIRSELGSTQSENLALRQEIATLKRTLLEGRGPAPVLPPPAALPASPSLASLSSPPSSSTSSSSNSNNATSSAAGPSSTLAKELAAAHTLKDVSSSSATARFWQGTGGLGMGGYTSVHTARIPELQLFGASPFAASVFASESTPAQAQAQQQENLNPLLNIAPSAKVTEVVRAGLGLGAGTGAPGANASGGGEAWGDANPFTVRSLDAYRMHLWGRMAAHAHHNGSAANTHSPPHSPPFPLSGLAGGLRPKYFASPLAGAFYAGHSTSTSSSSSSSNSSSSSPSLAGLSLSGITGKGAGLEQAQRQQQREREREKEREKERERETAMYAALASQTLLRRLGGAFWEAFSGADSSSSSSSKSLGGAGAASGKGWDAEKVRKVLEGRAVVRVVDVEPLVTRSAPGSPRIGASVPSPAVVPQLPTKEEGRKGECAKAFGAALEESMRSLSLGKK